LLYVAGVLYAEIHGILRGLPSVPWKVRSLLQVPVLFLLFQVSFRGPSDHRLLGRVIVWSAAVKAILAIWVQYVVAPKTGGPLDYATNHGDSVLFAVAAFILVAQLSERPGRNRWRTSALVLPILLVGMVANGRRIVWVMLATTLLVLYLITEWGAWKRRATRGVLIALPIMALYVAAGWTSTSAIFAPIKTFRTVSDGSIDASTLWREIENWNIAMSLKEQPILGVGLGGEYTEFRANGDLSAVFPEYRGWPHNSVLGLLFLAGLVGFSALWMLNAAPVFLAARAYRLAEAPDDRTAGLAVIAAVISCMSLAYGDLGPNFVQYRIFLALALMVSGKLAVATGAWPGAIRASS
jgi:O-antigen ligase